MDHLVLRNLLIPLEQVRLVIRSDAAFHKAQGGAPRGRLGRGEVGPWSPMIWRRCKVTRDVGSTSSGRNTKGQLAGALTDSADAIEMLSVCF